MKPAPLTSCAECGKGEDNSDVGALIHGLQPGPVTRMTSPGDVRLVDDKGVPVRRGAVGELLIRAPQLTPGYWTGPDRIEDAAPDGWYRTGDLMRQGDKDDLWFVARKKNLIIRGGSNISPLEVEHVLLSHPAVRDAAVVGIPDQRLGQRVAAVVQLATDADNRPPPFGNVQRLAAASSLWITGHELLLHGGFA